MSKLKNPIIDFKAANYPRGSVTQWFAENPELYSRAVCVGTQCLKGHNGIDIVAPHGTPIMAVAGGRVVEVKNVATGYGKHIRILNDTDEWVYGHLHRIDVVIGQQVAGGQQIGLMGNTGFVVSGDTPYWKSNPYAGTHLHLGRRPVTKIGPDGVTTNVGYPDGSRGFITDYDNGYFGFVAIEAGDFENYTGPVFDKPKYTFKNNLTYGFNHEDVAVLQKVLRYEGLMPGNIPYTTYYGSITRKAVADFQKKYGITTVFPGLYCYEKTRQKLNELYG
jgi:peptidoglycan hydrolase-like protein with peptidoglycan-binding domain